MINRALIGCIMLAKPLLRSFGVDTSQLEVILWTKVTVDDRKPASVNVYKKGKGGDGKNSGWLNFILLLFGTFFAAILFTIHKPLLAYALYFTVFTVYVTMNLIINFSDVLIDVRDHFLIMPRPVNDRTVAVARILHILIHLAKIVVPLGLPALIAVFYKSGVIAGLIFIISLVSATTLSVFAVNILYLLILQFMSPQRFRDVIAYFQIAFSIVIFAGYYVFPKLIKLADLNKISLASHPATYLLPSVWLAGLQTLGEGVFNQTTYIFSALALAAPVICLYVVVKFLSGNYSNKLSMMGSASLDTQKNSPRRDDAKPSYPERMGQLLTTSPLEQMGFRITWKLTSRLREFKVRVYPSLAFIPLIFFNVVFLDDSKQSLAEKWHHLPQTSAYLFILYSLVYLSIILLVSIGRSKNYQAAWFYGITPNRKPGLVLSGMLKAMMVKYHLPGAVLSIVFIMSIWGVGAALNILVALLMLVLVTLIIALIREKEFPFSRPASIDQQKGRTFYNIIYLLVPGGIGFLHYLVVDYPLVLIILSVVAAILIGVLFRAYRNVSWDTVAG